MSTLRLLTVERSTVTEKAGLCKSVTVTPMIILRKDVKHLEVSTRHAVAINILIGHAYAVSRNMSK